MYKPEIITIKKGDEIVKELAIFFNGHFSEYAIVLNPGHYLMISRERFNRIIHFAEENGYCVFSEENF